jgi:hypothetical protein
MAFLADYFKNEELSDIDLVFRTTSEHSRGMPEIDGEPASKRARRSSGKNSIMALQEPLQLAVLPGHKIVLYSSDYFKAQVGSTVLEDLWWNAWQR